MAERDVPAAPHRDAQRMHCVGHELAIGMDVTDVATIQLVYWMTLHEMLKFNDLANATAEFDDLLAHRDVARRFELVALTSALTETTSPVLASTDCSLTGLPVRALAAQA